MVARSWGSRVVSVWILVIRLASCAKSTLKVAVCNPGQVPYATVQANGTLTGYDVGDCLSFPDISPIFSYTLHSIKY